MRHRSEFHWIDANREVTLGKRIYRGLITYAFEQLRLHRVDAYNLATNKKIIKIKENLGFKLEGAHYKHLSN
jgi:RimJ/RimL family protein N-acetyltransferase